MIRLLGSREIVFVVQPAAPTRMHVALEEVGVVVFDMEIAASSGMQYGR